MCDNWLWVSVSTHILWYHKHPRCGKLIILPVPLWLWGRRRERPSENRVMLTMLSLVSPELFIVTTCDWLILDQLINVGHESTIDGSVVNERSIIIADHCWINTNRPTIDLHRFIHRSSSIDHHTLMVIDMSSAIDESEINDWIVDWSIIDHHRWISIVIDQH